MTDIHCHILPGIDDGASSMDDARLMAAMAADDGVTDIVVTPHVRYGALDFKERIYKIDRLTERLQIELVSAGIPINLHVGAEILCGGEIPEPLDSENIRCLGGTHCALVEFLFHESEAHMIDWSFKLRDGGITPIIAHPERYAAVQKSSRLTERFAELGCLLQLNKDSFEGRFGRKAELLAHRIIRSGHAAFIASDAHGPFDRTPRFGAVMHKLARLYGEATVDRLTAGESLGLNIR